VNPGTNSEGGGTGGSSAPANRGGGGGGQNPSGSNPNYPQSSGGSGFVAIRYADSFPVATSTTGSPTYLNSGGYHYYAWTGSGTVTF
jgi:hypothetical protein